jgi:hypothetical protein
VDLAAFPRAAHARGRRGCWPPSRRSTTPPHCPSAPPARGGTSTELGTTACQGPAARPARAPSSAATPTALPDAGRHWGRRPEPAVGSGKRPATPRPGSRRYDLGCGIGGESGVRAGRAARAPASTGTRSPAPSGGEPPSARLTDGRGAHAQRGVTTWTWPPWSPLFLDPARGSAPAGTIDPRRTLSRSPSSRKGRSGSSRPPGRSSRRLPARARAPARRPSGCSDGATDWSGSRGGGRSQWGRAPGRR